MCGLPWFGLSRYNLTVSQHKRHPGSGKIIGLGQGVELHSYLPASRKGEKRSAHPADLENIGPSLAEKARFMVVSYPANPLGAAAPDEFYPRGAHTNILPWLSGTSQPMERSPPHKASLRAWYSMRLRITLS